MPKYLLFRTTVKINILYNFWKNLFDFKFANFHISFCKKQTIEFDAATQFDGTVDVAIGLLYISSMCKLRSPKKKQIHSSIICLCNKFSIHQFKNIWRPIEKQKGKLHKIRSRLKTIELLMKLYDRYMLCVVPVVTERGANSFQLKTK